MKKLLLAAVASLIAGTGLAFTLMPSGLNQRQIEDAIAGSYNVQQVANASWDEGKLRVLVSWKDLTKGQPAAEQLCSFFPTVSSIMWDDKVGEPHRHQCQ